MTYTVKWSHEFKRNVKRAVKRGLDPSEIETTRFTASLRDAANATIMTCVTTGTHSDIFKE